jgi:hypothetical protein
VLAEAGWAAAMRGDESTAKQMLHQSVDAQRAGARFAAAAFTYLLTLSRDQTDRERLEMVAEGLELAGASGDRLAEIGLRCAYASTLAVNDRAAEAERHARRALDDARALGQPTLEVAALFSLGQSSVLSDPGAAMTYLRTSLELGRRHHSEAEEGAILMLLAYVESRSGDSRHALETIRERLVWQLTAPIQGLPHFYLGTSAFTRVGRADLVALCEGNSRVFSAAVGSFPTPLWQSLHDEELVEARAALGEQRFEELAIRGASLTLDEFNILLLPEIDAILAEVP